MLLLACATAAIGAAAQPAAAQQPTHRESARPTPQQHRGKVIPGRFIVVLEPRADPRAVAAEVGAKPDFVYSRVLNGFAGSIGEAARAGLLKDHRVVRIEPDKPVHASVTTTSWGLDRIDQKAQPLDAQYNPDRTGRGVSVYIVDTGIRFDHQIFGGRAVPGIDVVGDGRNGNDCDGHGTHIAGIAGGAAAYGVAPGVRLVSARVLDCEGSGTSSGVIAALDWIAKNGVKPAVVNLSLGGEAHASTDDAVRRLIAAGFPVVVAAGNDNADACQRSPARVAEAATIGASNKADARASFSNHGSCLDMFAPGEAITSAWATGTTALASGSGTSMAAPHVAGAAALLLEANPAQSPHAVRDALYQATTKSVVAQANSSNNHLLFVASADTTTEPASPAPEPTSPSSPGGVTIRGTAGNDSVHPTRTVSGQPYPSAGPDVIDGLGGHDSLSGEGGDDRISGGDGYDAIYGGPGNDWLDGGAGIDRATYTNVTAGVTVRLDTASPQDTRGGGTDTLLNFENVLASNYSDVVWGDGGNNELHGIGGNDKLYGLAGNDKIYGGTGNDALSGGTGKDDFYFDTALNPSFNVDRMNDYSAADDSVYLKRTVFAALPATGTLPAAAFRSGPLALDADDRIIFDPTSARIYYDPDGSGPAAQVYFANVPLGRVLTNADFIAY